MKRRRFRNITFWLMLFLLAVAVIAVYKTVGNFDKIFFFFSGGTSPLLPSTPEEFPF